MAKALPCDLCEAPIADLMVSMIATGDTMAICARCIPAWAEAFTSALDAIAAGVPDELPAAEPSVVVTDAEWEESAAVERQRSRKSKAPAGNGAVAEASEAAPATVDQS